MDQKSREQTTHIIEIYIQWFTQTTEALFFGTEMPALPTDFDEWLEVEERTPTLSSEIIQPLEQSYQALKTSLKDIMAPPSKDNYQNLASSYETFIKYLVRLNQQDELGNTDVDILTGLRNANHISEDTKRELERFTRHGKPFTMILMRIYNFEQVQDTLQIISALIQKSLRSFDDAYYLEDGEILLSLKQTNVSGGKQMLRRLHQSLEAYGSEVADITFSASIGEPAPGEKIAELIKSFREDLNANSDKEDIILETSMLSPLQRYAKTQEDIKEDV